MPTTPVTTPSGEVIQVNHPDGASQADILKFAAASVGIQPTARPVMQRNPQERMDDISAFDRFAYEFAASPNLTGNLAVLAEAALPLGFFGDPSGEGNGFYTSPSEAYGEDYDELSFDERRQRINEYKERVRQNKFPELSRLAEQGADTGAAGMVGAFAKGVADPSIFAPVGKGIGKVAAISGILGGSYEATRGLAEEGRIDPMMTATATAGGAVLGAGADKLIRSIAPNYNRLKAAAKAKRTEREALSANAKMDEINSKIIEMQAEGLDVENPVMAAIQRLNIEPKEAVKIVTNATETFDIPHPEIARAAKEYREVLDRAAVPSGFAADFIGVVSTQIKKINPQLYKYMQEFELAKMSRVASHMRQIQGFEKLESALPVAERDKFALFLNNQEMDSAIELLKNYGINQVKTGTLGNRKVRSVDEIMDGVRAVLDDIHASRLTVDPKAQKLDNFFPRFNNDVDATRRALGLTAKQDSRLQKMLEAKAKSLKNKTVNDLTQAQKTAVMDDFLRNDRSILGGKSIPSQYKARTIAQLDSDLIKYYDRPLDALTKYITRMTDDTEMRRVFNNKLAVVSDEGELNIDESIGSYVARLKDEGAIDDTGADELQKYMSARFINGNQSMNKVLTAMKNVSNMILLGNPISAATQLGDLFVAAHRYGIQNTLSSILDSVASKTQINSLSLGITKIMAEEASDATGLAKLLDGALTYSGFRQMDRIGKDVALEAAFKMNKNLVKSDKGIQKLREKWGDVYGVEFDSLVADLRAGAVTDNVKLLMFSELSGHQPISLLEMPLKYLQVPNGRVFYNLKSFGLKQLDMLRNSVGAELKKGNYGQAAKLATSYLGIVTMGGATVQEAKNWMQGRGFDITRVPDNFVDQLMMTAMTSRYAVENKLGSGDYMGLLIESASPPTTALSNITKDVVGAIKGVYSGEGLPAKSARSVPLIGRAYYNLVGGGAEEFLERRED